MATEEVKSTENNTISRFTNQRQTHDTNRSSRVRTMVRQCCEIRSAQKSDRPAHNNIRANVEKHWSALARQT